MEAFVERMPSRIPGSGSGVVASAAYAGGRRIKDVPLREPGTWARRGGHFVRRGLHAPDSALLSEVREQLGLHPLVIEDTGEGHQQPKVGRYGESLFVVARTAQTVEGRIAFGGRGIVVTVRHGASASDAAVRRRNEVFPTELA